MTEQDAALLMTLIPDVRPALARSIFDTFGGFLPYFQCPFDQLPAKLAGPANHYRRDSTVLEDQLASIVEQARRQGIQLLSLASPDYPTLLKNIHDPPPLLYVMGSVDVLALPQMAIVGSRHASHWGVSLAERFAASLARGGFTITSGMALGVDGAAHRGALAGGSTVAVLGCGVDVAYPRQHARLREDILAAGGAMVSELPPGTGPLRHHFPRRNRIISGLSLGVLIVEAAARSGSLITARLAMEQGREVFAIPGSIQNPLSRGCHQLIREGAVLTESLDDIVSQLGGMLALKQQEVAEDGPSPLPADPVAERILAAMGYTAVDVDTLQQLLGLAVPELTVALVNLEIQGYVENRGGVYQRIR